MGALPMSSSLADPWLSLYGRRSTSPSPVSRMMSAFARDFRPGVDINLGVGYVNEETIPGQQIAQALQAVLSRPDVYPHALNYGGSEGSPNLVSALRRFLVRNDVGGLTERVLEQRRIIIGASGVTSLLDAIATVMRPGIVVTGDPLYYIYSDYLARLGFTLLPIPEDHEGLKTELIQERLAPVLDQLSFFYVVTVGNPTSSILTNSRRRELVSIATRISSRLGRQVPLFLDNAYELLVHGPSAQRLEACSLHDAARIVYELGTLSKILAPALRIGYVLGPPGTLMDALVQHTSDVGFSAPLINQEMAAYLLDHVADDHVRLVNAGYRAKAAAVRGWIESELGSELEDVRGGEAGFYYYLTFVRTHTQEGSPLYRYASRTTGRPEVDGGQDGPNPRVVYVPGAFCVHPQGDYAEAGRRQLRLSYGYASLDEIRRGLVILGEAARYARDGSL
jgi:2-aminoadipate transaminase